MDDEFLTVADVAELLKLNPQTVRNWIDRGELAALRVGTRRVRIRRSELERFIADSETRQPAEPGESVLSEEHKADLREAVDQTKRALGSKDDAQLVEALRELSRTAERLAARLDSQTS